MKKQFKTESKQILNLMIHSIYSNKDIFLRELISNASDALDKRHYMEIQTKDKDSSEMRIDVAVDKNNRTIIISDTGIGMDVKDLEKNLGTIAHSGSSEFMKEIEDGKANEVDIIGQFGVGFYSSFIVGSKVEVTSKKFPSEVANTFKSDGVSSYSIEESTLDFYGTQIIIHVKDGEDFEGYVNDENVKELIQKHNDYVKYPIYMDEEKTVELSNQEDGSKEETTTLIENNIINSQIAIWKKVKKDVSKDEYNEFYKSKFHDFTDPLYIIHSHAEGVQSLDLLLFIPAQKPFDFYQSNFKKGLDLYSKGILIDHSVEYLLPSHFSFVKGVVDSEDINLNISRELLQQDRVVDKIKKSVSAKIKRELLKLQSKKREDYNKFYNEFGRTLMYGVYDEFGKNSTDLEDLIMFKSSKNEEYVTLKEYINENAEQEEIYYISGSSIEAIKQMPIMEKVKGKEIEILYLINDIDEFAIQMLREYKGKNFKSIISADLSSEDEKKVLEEKNIEAKPLLEKIKEALIDDISDVRVTDKLNSSAVCLVNDGEISIEQEKLLSQMPDNNYQGKKILEINPEHALYKAMLKYYDNADNSLDEIATLLYNQALLIEGLELKDPAKHAELLNKLIISTIG